MGTVASEEPILCRIDRLDNIMRQLEEMRCSSNRSPNSSWASTSPSSGTHASEEGGPPSFTDLSPRSLEKHCRPMRHVMMEAEQKGSLVERLDQVEDRLLKMEQEAAAERIRDEASKKRRKKGLRRLLVGTCVKAV